jgi:hypothetical protein
LHNPGQVLPQLQQEGDSFIMDAVIALGRFSPTELIQINQCHMAFCAMTMVDIVMGDGSHITPDAHHFTLEGRQASNWIWPIKHPCHLDILLWKKALMAISSDSLHLFFLNQLGRWSKAPHLKWSWYYDPSSRSLFHCNDSVWQHFQPFAPQSTWSYQLIGTLDNLDVSTLHLASAHWSNGTLQFDGMAPLVPPDMLALGTIHNFISQWPSGWILEDSYFP